MKQTVEEAARTHWNESTYNKDAELAYDERDCIAIKALAKAIALRAFKEGAKWQLKQSPWISVKERLPKHNIEVIICHEREFYIGKMYYSMQSNWWRVSDDGRTDMIVNEDDSWMPIPSFDEALEANRDVLERIKEKGD